MNHLELVKQAGLVPECASNKLRRILEDVTKDLQYIHTGIGLYALTIIIATNHVMFRVKEFK